MSEERDKKLYETAISLRPYVYAAMDEAKKAKAKICVIGLSTITIEEAKIIRDALNLIVNSPPVRANIGSGFIPEKMWSKDCIWRDFKKLLDGE